jgi:ATP synthase protein I
VSVVTTEEIDRRGAEVRDGLVTNLVGAGLAVAVGAVVAAGGGLLGLGVAGRPQALGAVLGAGLMTAFYLFGTVTVSLVAAYAPRASLLVALLTYVLQVGALALVLARVQASASAGATVDVGWVGGAVVVATVAWLVLLLVRAVRSTPSPGRDPRPVSRDGVGG